MTTIDHRFDSPAALAEALADTVAQSLREGLEARGAASLVVSGGSTPRPFFEALSTREVDWPSVTVTLADERWVPPDHEASNHRLVARHLLRGEAATARFVPLWSDTDSVSDGARRAVEKLQSVPRPFDVVVFGMGGDGHTASLFPERSLGLDDDDPAVVAVEAPSSDGHPRLSLSLATLLDSRRRILHVTGDEKWRVYRRALEPGPTTELPIRGVLRGPGDGPGDGPGTGPGNIDVFWAP